MALPPWPLPRSNSSKPVNPDSNPQYFPDETHQEWESVGTGLALVLYWAVKMKFVRD